MTLIKQVEDRLCLVFRASWLPIAVLLILVTVLAVIKGGLLPSFSQQNAETLRRIELEQQAQSEVLSQRDAKINQMQQINELYTLHKQRQHDAAIRDTQSKKTKDEKNP